MSTADLIATLRRLALVDDLPECAQAADEIERLRGLVEEMHRFTWSKLTTHGDLIVAGCANCLHPTMEYFKQVDLSVAERKHADHVRQILDGGGA